MNGFWVGPWLHCAPEQQFVHGRRAVSKCLCFGPAAAQTWFVTEEGGCFYEEQILEGIQAGERSVEPVTQADLLGVLDGEIDLCRRFQGEALIPLFQAEREKLMLEQAK